MEISVDPYTEPYMILFQPVTPSSEDLERQGSSMDPL